MALKELEIEFFAKFISAEIEKSGFLERKRGYELVKISLEELKKIEEEIDKKAEDLLSQHISKFPDVDKKVALDMIKRKIAEEKGVEANWTSEKVVFLTNWIWRKFMEKADLKEPDRLRKLLGTVVSNLWEELLKISAEISDFLRRRGIRQYTLEWDKRFSEEFSRRLKESLRKG